ncbi:L-rhamnose mutarotase [Flavihumibacter fluvii]|jgi:L-rhamnose mutarotase|uniref:L-rhamnose mutarotase n=1 Tax=Flavihumibacter fluvii TaxID=2838157 RepID=UPI001BDDF4CE|nr:L-rhamnose mutarotase [Flavihumibacter fluvii]ULQ51900.1 L-rhamnose mutarotase [Flavihumibacter fluvii]
MNKRYYLALDLKDEPEAIATYEDLHKRVSPHIIASIRNSDITQMELYRTGNRLFMIMETGPDFSFEAKALADASDPLVQEWETLVGTYQQALPWAKPGEKWVLMDPIFRLTDYL